MITDKRTIGLTADNERILGELVRAGHFASEIDAGKFAMAHAIKAGAPRGTSEGVGTKWNVGSVDPDGALKAIVQALFAEERQPYRLVEHLMNEGLRMLDAGEALSPDVAGIMISAASA